MEKSDSRERYRPQPLDGLTWLEELQRLENDLSIHDTGTDPTRLIRRAFYLAWLAPDPFWSAMCPDIGEESLEDALVESHPSSARKILGSMQLRIDVIRALDGYAAMVKAPHLGLSAEAWAADADVAVLRAWTQSILATPEGFDHKADDAETSNVINLEHHRYRSARPQ